MKEAIFDWLALVVIPVLTPFAFIVAWVMS